MRVIDPFCLIRQNLDSLLLNNRKLNSFAFTIRPSFTGELGCYYENSELVLRIANKCIWYSKNIEINEYRCKISDEAANSINQLFFAAIFSSSYLAQPDGLDGETYELLVNGGITLPNVGARRKIQTAINW